MPKLTKDIRIRKATFDDAPEIFKMGEKSFKSYGTEDWSFTLVAEFLEEYPLFSFIASKGKKLLRSCYQDRMKNLLLNFTLIGLQLILK